MINGEKHENKDIEEIAGKVQICQDVAAVILEFEEIIIWLMKQQGNFFLTSRKGIRF